MTTDDLVLGTIVARNVETRLDQFYLVQQLQHTAITEERVRLARDLHDGLLQSLTGAALQLETSQRLVEQDPEGTRERLLDVQRLLSAEQRELRSFIQELKLPSLTPAETPVNLLPRLEELSGQIERHWGVHVTMDLAGLKTELPTALALDMYRIVHEALINVARHANATAAQVELVVEESQVRITVTDNGRGFSFRGHYDLAALTALHLGPVSLRERIASLGGSLSIDSTDTGAHLTITLPLVRPGARNAYSSCVSR
ncbi:MAG: sensor histidine kinase [Candidatus Binatia bacterium]